MHAFQNLARTGLYTDRMNHGNGSCESRYVRAAFFAFMSRALFRRSVLNVGGLNTLLLFYEGRGSDD